MLEASELLLHLLVAGQEPDEIATLFRAMDANGDGVISKEEWRTGFARFLALAHTPGAAAYPLEPSGAILSGSAGIHLGVHLTTIGRSRL